MEVVTEPGSLLWFFFFIPFFILFPHYILPFVLVFYYRFAEKVGFFLVAGRESRGSRYSEIEFFFLIIIILFMIWFGLVVEFIRKVGFWGICDQNLIFMELWWSVKNGFWRFFAAWVHLFIDAERAGSFPS